VFYRDSSSLTSYVPVPYYALHPVNASRQVITFLYGSTLLLFTDFPR
jgi:hypothetical protein